MDYATDPTLYRRLIILFKFPSQVVFRTSLGTSCPIHPSLVEHQCFWCSCSSDLTTVEWNVKQPFLISLHVARVINIDVNKTKRQRPPLKQNKRWNVTTREQLLSSELGVSRQSSVPSRHVSQGGLCEVVHGSFEEFWCRMHLGYSRRSWWLWWKRFASSHLGGTLWRSVGNFFMMGLADGCWHWWEIFQMEKVEKKKETSRVVALYLFWGWYLMSLGFRFTWGRGFPFVKIDVPSWWFQLLHLFSSLLGEMIQFGGPHIFFNWVFTTCLASATDASPHESKIDPWTSFLITQMEVTQNHLKRSLETIQKVTWKNLGQGNSFQKISLPY